MRIETLSFYDRSRNWRLEEVAFDSLNLLVGPTGAGKTRIVEALRAVHTIATESNPRVPACEWTIAFTIGTDSFRWSGAIERVEGTSEPGVRIVEEKLTRGDSVIVERKRKQFTLNGKELPVLKESDSAFVLLQDDTSLKPLAKAVELIYFADGGAKPEDFVSFPTDAFEESFSALSTMSLGPRAPAHGRVVYALALQEFAATRFVLLRESFFQVFPTVKGLRIARKPSGNSTTAQLEILEEGCDRWIPQRDISAGMLRTFFQLLLLLEIPAGAVFIIDEFENSLGVNCMPELTRRLLARSADVQFVVTSHHPYVINQMPVSSWKLVTRSGSTVRLVPASAVPELQTKSHLDAFTQLLNSEQYESAIS